MAKSTLDETARRLRIGDVERIDEPLSRGAVRFIVRMMDRISLKHTPGEVAYVINDLAKYSKQPEAMIEAINGLLAVNQSGFGSEVKLELKELREYFVSQIVFDEMFKEPLYSNPCVEQTKLDRPNPPKAESAFLDADGESLVERMVGEVGLEETAREFPHILNELGALVDSVEDMVDAIDQILGDERIAIEGLSFLNILELESLRDHVDGLRALGSGGV